MNFIFISPNFPENYCAFLTGLKNVGFNVLGIGDAPYDSLLDETKQALTEYYRCYNMENLEEKAEAVKYFSDKYGQIDFIESNNEYWLRSDAQLRERFGINGLYPKDMDNITNKEFMKNFFVKGGAKVARYHIVDNKENCLDFIKNVGYPVFVKPTIGVGAQKTFKINNEEELNNFFAVKDNYTTFIMEEFITGELMSFDGVCNSNSDVIICDESHFPTPIDIVLHEQLDNRYYTTAFIDPEFEKLGRNVVKAFGIKKRFFHIEFFRLDADKPGLGKKGDYVGVECNMRPPGGSTPDLINFALSTSCYQVWADVMMFDENRQRTDYEKFIAIAVTRRDRFNYVHNSDVVRSTYINNICLSGRTPEILSDALGNDFFYGKFKTLKEAMDFADFVLMKVN